MDSPLSSVMKTRNQVSVHACTYMPGPCTCTCGVCYMHMYMHVQLMWRFVASEEDYVSQLTILNDEYRQQFEIAAASRKPPLTLKQSNDIFRNRQVHVLMQYNVLSCDMFTLALFM